MKGPILTFTFHCYRLGGFAQQMAKKTWFLNLQKRWLKSGDQQLMLVVYPILHRVSYIPGGCLGFQPSTGWPELVRSETNNLQTRLSYPICRPPSLPVRIWVLPGMMHSKQHWHATLWCGNPEVCEVWSLVCCPWELINTLQTLRFVPRRTY